MALTRYVPGNTENENVPDALVFAVLTAMPDASSRLMTMFSGVLPSAKEAEPLIVPYIDVSVIAGIFVVEAASTIYLEGRTFVEKSVLVTVTSYSSVRTSFFEKVPSRLFVKFFRQFLESKERGSH